MKDAGTLAKRYADALFNLSSREKNLAAVEKAFDSFVNQAYKNPRFAVFMSSPVIPQATKESLLEKILPSGTPPLLMLFLRLVLTKKRFEILRLIENSFQLQSEKSRGIRRAEFISAVPVEASTEKKLTAILEKRLATSQPVKVNLVTKVDKNLVGGFILKLDERVVDASYRTRLREIRQQLTAAPL